MFIAVSFFSHFSLKCLPPDVGLKGHLFSSFLGADAPLLEIYEGGVDRRNIYFFISPKSLSRGIFVLFCFCSIFLFCYI